MVILALVIGRYVSNLVSRSDQEIYPTAEYQTTEPVVQQEREARKVVNEFRGADMKEHEYVKQVAGGLFQVRGAVAGWDDEGLLVTIGDEEKKLVVDGDVVRLWCMAEDVPGYNGVTMKAWEVNIDLSRSQNLGVAADLEQVKERVRVGDPVTAQARVLSGKWKLELVVGYGCSI